MHSHSLKSYPPSSHNARRAEVPKTAIKELSRIPGVGPALATDLYLVGITHVADLKGRDPSELYKRLEDLVGVSLDPCVLYVFRCAVYFSETAQPDPEKLKWWNWKTMK